MNKWHWIGFLLIIIAFVHRPDVLRELWPRTTVLRRGMLRGATAPKLTELSHRLNTLFATCIFLILGVASLLYAWEII